MDYFRNLSKLLELEKEEDKRNFTSLIKNLSTNQRRENGLTWFPIAIKGTETGLGDYLTIEVDRTSYFDILHQFRFGMRVALFSNHDAATDRIEGTVSHISGNTMKIA